MTNRQPRNVDIIPTTSSVVAVREPHTIRT